MLYVGEEVVSRAKKRARWALWGLLSLTSLAIWADPNVYPNDYGNNYGGGKAFFYSNVLPRLAENGCFACHARGYVRPSVTVYEDLLKRLAIGDSAENNVVIYKMANIRSFNARIPNHPGGQRCASIDDEPCKSLREWWDLEFGAAQN